YSLVKLSGIKSLNMVATAATASLFPVSSPKPHSGAGRSGNAGNVLGVIDMRGNKTKYVNSAGMQVKANSQASAESRKRVINVLKTDDNSTSHASRTVINQLPDWSVLLAAITTIFLAAEKQWMMMEWKTKRPDMLTDLAPFGFGKIVQDGHVFRENFSIRSYEVDADRNASIETIMNHLQVLYQKLKCFIDSQETALNHVKSVGLMGDGFGSTPEMVKRNLFWAVTKMRVIVERYPTWGDVVQVNTWTARNGKNSMRRDWLLRDYKTGEMLIRASSNWVMMNKVTRRLSKIPDEVLGEIERHFVDAPPVVDDDDCRKLPKLEETTADYVRSGLTPRWSDLDVNQHVNNVKKNSVVKSLTSVLGGGGSGSGDDDHNGGIDDSNHVDCQHVLLYEGGGDSALGGEIVKAQTKWRPKYTR
ncbi:LOW QUALITY PROTEIN: hypothetical protein M8C21_033278, partial [Ambrosia artemisiifolia]